MGTHGRLVGYVSPALGAFDESHTSSYSCGAYRSFSARPSTMSFATSLAGSLWGSEHSAQLCDLARQQAVHDPSNAAFQQADARGAFDLVLQPTYALDRPGDDARRLRADRLGRRLCRGSA